METIKGLLSRFALISTTLLFSFSLMAIDFLRTNIPYTLPVLVAPVICYFIILLISKGEIQCDEFIQDELAKMNYTVLSERLLNFQEQKENFEWDFGFNYFSGTSTVSWLYKNKMLRHFKVQNEKGYTFELIITIIKTWGNKIVYRIISTTRISDECKSKK